MIPKKLVIVGLRGTPTRSRTGPHRWEPRRSTVSFCQQEDRLVRRLELLHDRKAISIAEAVLRQMTGVLPKTETCPQTAEFSSLWDFEELYGAPADFACGYCKKRADVVRRT